MRFKAWLLVFAILPILFMTVSFVLADESSPSAEFNPNVVFWPLSAGKTIDDNLYFLKELKENLRGMIIFGSMQKSDYKITLGTKRLLEAEKLFELKKTEAGLKTLDKASSQFKDVLTNIEKTDKSKMSSKIKLNIIRKLQETREYGRILQSKGDDKIKQKLNDIDKQEEKILNILY